MPSCIAGSSFRFLTSLLPYMTLFWCQPMAGLDTLPPSLGYSLGQPFCWVEQNGLELMDKTGHKFRTGNWYETNFVERRFRNAL